MVDCSHYRLLLRSYELMRQTCSLLRIGVSTLSSAVLAGCSKPLLGTGSSRRCLRNSFLRCLVLNPDGPTEIAVGTIIADRPRADPDGRSLAHPVLISDDWRQSDRQGKDGALAVEGAIGQPGREHGSMRTGVSGCGGGVYATTAP